MTMLRTAAGYGILTPGRYIQADSNFINGGDLGYGTLLNFGTTVVTGGTTNSPSSSTSNYRFNHIYGLFGYINIYTKRNSSWR